MKLYRKLKKILFPNACIALMLTSCATKPAKQNVGTAPRPDYLIKEYTPDFTWTTIEKETGSNGAQRIKLILPEQDPLLIDFHQAELNAPLPALLVSPILGGKNKIANHFARYFAQHGYHSMVVHRPKDLKEGIDNPIRLDNSLRNAVLRDRLALDWLSSLPEVKPDAIGSFGISYGGIKNTVLVGVDDRLKANVIALAGADMPSIITKSNLENLQEARQNAMKKNGWSLDELELEIRKSLKTEPLRFAPYIDPETTLLILARMDHTVPRENGEILREALRSPETLYLPTGHYTGALMTGMFTLPYIENKALTFLNKHLKP